MSTDRNLLAGILALNFVSGEQLLAGMHAWVANKQRQLLDVLREQGALEAADVEAVNRMMERHIARHGGDAAKSLAAVKLDPDVGDQLAKAGDAEVRDGLSTVNSVRPTATPPLATEVGPVPMPVGASLRYRRLRGHAKGGLGEVSVALDEELRREVALKEIQARFADFPEYRGRFVREAEITGQLEHPGIVPVYGLGATPDGRPYYAMRFIGGDSLDAAIRRYHDGDGDLRSLLNRFVAMCNAVGFAHSRGVIHRDLKPANVMLGEYGETLVVDWGLARRLAEKEDETRIGRPVVLSPGEATVEGQLIGTPAYMPPEQASGRLEEVGPHSDVWALGAMLYAILTGKPPYEGDAARLDAVACEPRPAMRVKAGVPAALDAICRKAMAKWPGDRYGKARELATEVERWLADEPVSAYRDPLSVRAMRWARKHRTVTSSLVVLLVSGLVALAVVMAVARIEAGKTKQALREAEDNLVVARSNLRLAKEAVDECFNVAKDHPLFRDGGMLPVKQLLLAKTLPFYSRITSRGAGEPLAQEEAEQAFRVGYITAQLGRHDEALEANRKAEAIFRRLADAAPDALGYRRGLANTLNHTALLLSEVGKKGEALAAYRRAEDAWQRLADAHPETHDHLNGLAGTLNNIGLLLRDLGKYAEALKMCRRAEDLCQRLAETHPDNPDYRSYLANIRNNIGGLLYGLGNTGEALTAYQQAEATSQQLADAHPDVLDYQNRLAGTVNNIGLLLLDLRKDEEALKAFRRAEAIHQRVADAHPSVPLYQSDLAAPIYNTALLLARLNRHEEALQAYRRAEVLYQRLADTHPEVADYRSRLAGTLNNISSLFAGLRKHDEAFKMSRRAGEVYQKLAHAHPTIPEYQIGLALTFNNMGMTLDEQGKRGEALKAYLRACDLYTRLVKTAPSDINLRTKLGKSHYLIGRIWSTWVATANARKRSTSLQQQEADKLTREALHHLRQAKQSGFLANPAMRDYFAKDAGFAALRDRPDFKAFVASLDKP